MSKANNIKVHLDGYSVHRIVHDLRAVAAYLEQQETEPTILTASEQDTLADSLTAALRGIKCLAIVISHNSVRDWVLDEDHGDMSAAEINEVLRLFDRSEMTGYEVRDMLRSCADDVIDERKKKKAAKKKGGRRA